MAGLLAAMSINKVIDVVDVDGVVRRIDINNVVERIDVNNVVERIDVDRAVSRIDIDRVLQKVDWNKTVMDRIDFDAIIKKVDTKSIVLRSSTGALDAFVDTLRTHVVLLDLYLWVVTRGNIFSRRTRQLCYLPPRPGTGLRQRDDQKLYPKGRSNKAVAVQGRYVGFVTKVLVMMLDMFTISVLFSLMWRFLEWCLVLFLGSTRQEAEKQAEEYQNNVLWAFIVYWTVYWFGYFFICTWLTGQTLGMLVMGCKVINCSEDGVPSWRCVKRRRQRRHRHQHQHEYLHSYPVTFCQAFMRTLVLPVTLTFCPPLLIMGLYRRDGRMLHDWFAGTGMIYRWDAKLARMREKAQRDADRYSSESSAGASLVTDASDEFDEWIDDVVDSDSEINVDSDSGQGLEVRLGEEPLLGSQIQEPTRSRVSSKNDYQTFE
jgi:uncharacterized RDD family membrane protein YckC